MSKAKTIYVYTYTQAEFQHLFPHEIDQMVLVELGEI